MCDFTQSPPAPSTLIGLSALDSAVLGLGDRKLYLRRYKYLRWYRWLYSEVVLRLDGVSLELEGCLLIGDKKPLSNRHLYQRNYFYVAPSLYIRYVTSTRHMHGVL